MNDALLDDAQMALTAAIEELDSTLLARPCIHNLILAMDALLKFVQQERREVRR